MVDNISIYTNKDGRTRVYLKGSKRVISYPRYIMENELGRPLDKTEQVHHIDDNPLNNDSSNLKLKGFIVIYCENVLLILVKSSGLPKQSNI